MVLLAMIERHNCSFLTGGIVLVRGILLSSFLYKASSVWVSRMHMHACLNESGGYVKMCFRVGAYSYFRRFSEPVAIDVANAVFRSYTRCNVFSSP